MNSDFVRYLEAKQSVDDRALNRNVADAMKRFVHGFRGDLRAFEVGAGHGAMVERFAREGLIREASYTAIDPARGSIAEARRRFQSDPRIGELELIVADLYEFQTQTSETWDLVVAHAVLDLLDLDRAIPVLRALSSDSGRFYFTINFDGESAFEPVIDPVLDAEVLGLYHETMDARLVDGERSGHSRTGRRLFGALSDIGATIEQTGSSDWVVWPNEGTYPGDEAYFLHFIVSTVGEALADSSHIEERALRRWVDERHAQIDRGELVYLAHQLDFFGRWTEAPTRSR